MKDINLTAGARNNTNPVVLNVKQNVLSKRFVHNCIGRKLGHDRMVYTISIAIEQTAKILLKILLLILIWPILTAVRKIIFIHKFVRPILSFWTP